MGRRGGTGEGRGGQGDREDRGEREEREEREEGGEGGEGVLTKKAYMCIDAASPCRYKGDDCRAQHSASCWTMMHNSAQQPPCLICMPSRKT